MKVGIITQPLYSNYGGILQNYALQQVLKKMGHIPVTLDYLPSLSIGRYFYHLGKGIVHSLSHNHRYQIKPYSKFIIRPPEIEAFIKKEIDLTKTIKGYSKELLEKNGIEAVVVGSDQVWRYAYNYHYLDDMYLAFAKDFKCVKLAYAASFGVEKWDYPELKTTVARELINLFKAISVREDTAINLCREYLGVEPKVVLDPTLLLNASDYEKFCTEPNPSEPPYLAAYVLDKSDNKTDYLDSVARAKGLAIKEMTVSNYGCSIEEWLSSIKNASYVITDSYHGTIFSILFRKQFHTFINKERGADRFITLFERLGISDGDIDYDKVETDLNQCRERSLAFISDNLK